MTTYILEGHIPKPEPDILKWAKWFENAKRHIARDDPFPGMVHVSTVFLGTDHAFGQGPPLFFETMVFGGPLHEEMDRYETWDAAELGHALMLARVLNAGPGEKDG